MNAEDTTEKIERHLLAASVIPTGNSWLDDALFGGLNKNNVMLVAARTGVGKTFFGVQLAHFASKAGREVLYFALEAEKFEIERRLLYYRICRLLHEFYPQLPVPEYREWMHLGYNNQWAAIEEEAQRGLSMELSSLKTIYRRELYTPEMFKQDIIEKVAMVPDEERPQLIILDHLHHFFLSGSDEIESLKTCIHGIKQLQMELEVPIVILAQLRKGDGKAFGKRTMPVLEDIRGTASLTDVATDVLIISAVSEDKTKELPEDFYMPMYFHLAKSRTAAKVRQYAAIIGFDIKKGEYSKRYCLSEVKFSEDPSLLEKEKIPKWAKNAIRFNKPPQIRGIFDANRQFKDE